MSATPSGISPSDPLREQRETVMLAASLVWAMLILATTPPTRGVEKLFHNNPSGTSIALFGPICLWAVQYIVRLIFATGGSQNLLLGARASGLIACLVCGIQTLVSGGIVRSPLISGIAIVVLLSTSMAEEESDKQFVYYTGVTVILAVAVLSWSMNRALEFVSQSNVSGGSIIAYTAIAIVALLLDRAVNSGVGAKIFSPLAGSAAP